MKKKLLGAVLSVGALIGLASCGVEPHEHSFADGWSSNDGGHWHACECDDRLHDSFAAHVDANKDEKCDVCGHAVKVNKVEVEKPAHEHSFAEAWSSSAQGHWHACECDANLFGSFAAHSDANNDGKCDVCAYDVEKQHVHTYATEWSKDSANHWHDSTCDHKVVSDKAAHTMGTDNKCTVCGYGSAAENVATLKAIDANADACKKYYNIGDTFSADGLVIYETYSNTLTDDTVSVGDIADYTVVVEDAAGNAVTGAFAAHGTYTVTVSTGSFEDIFEVAVIETAYDSVADAFATGVENNDNIAKGSIVIDFGGDYSQNYEFAFGDNYTLIKQGEDEQHFQLLEDGTALQIAVTKYSDIVEISAFYDQDPASMYGVSFNRIFNYEDVIGTTELLNKLIEMAESESASNYKESLGSMCSCDECAAHAAYKFSFDYAYDDADYTYEVSFTLDDLTKTIDKIEMKVTSTYEGYNWETDEYELITDVKLVSIEQNAGEKNAENPYKLDELTYESFDLVNANEEKVANNAEITMTVGENVYLYIANATPTTALPSIDQIEVFATNEDGEETYSAGGSYDSFENNIYLYAYKAGKYNVKISSLNVTYNYVLNVNYAELEEFDAAVYDSTSYNYVIKDSITVYQNAEVDFKAMVNENANGTYTAAFATDYENATLEEGGDNNYLFKASAVGVYDITLTSTVDTSITATLTITVVELPNVADILVGNYKYVSNMLGTVTYEFTPASEGATNGTLHITNAGSPYGVPDGEGFFNYEFTGGALVCTPANAGSGRYAFSAELNSDLQIVCLYNFYQQGPCEKVEASVEDEEKSSPLIGTFNTAKPHPMTGRDQNYSVVFNEDGTGSYNFQNYYEFGSFNYTFVDGVITFSNIETGGSVVALTAAIDGDKLTITYEFMVGEDETASNNVEFTVEGLSGDSNDEEPSSGIEIEATKWGVPYNFTADKTGNYTFTVAETDGSMIYDFGDPCNTVTVFLTAGQTIELGILDKDDNGLVTLNVEYEEVEIEASTFEDAITKNWICEIDGGDVYFLAFDGEQFILTNRFMGTTSTGTYSYSHDGNGNISYTYVEGENFIYSMYGPYGTISFDESFTRLTIGEWNFVIYE